MKCEEFQRIILSEPERALHSDMRHKDDCKICAEFVVEITTLDNHLQDALQVPIPPEIQDELYAKKISKKASKRIKSLTYVVIASIMFLLGVVLFINLSSS